MVHDIDVFAKRFVQEKARQLRYHAAPAGLDREDVEGELLLNLVQKRPRFDPGRGKWTTFVRMVTNHRAADLVALWSCPRRNPKKWFSTTSDVEIDSEETEPSSSRGRASQGIAREPVVESEIEQVNLRLDMEQALAQLPASDETFCRLLPHVTQKDLAAQLGVCRSTVERHRKEIGQRLLEVGLQHYLPSARKL